MKITSQRTLLWSTNFVVVGGILGLLFLMFQNSNQKIGTRQRERLRGLERAVRGVKVDTKRVQDRQGPIFAAVLDRKNFWAGYVAPPKPVAPKPKPENNGKPPPLGNFINVLLVASSQSNSAGEPDIADGPLGGAIVKVKSKPVNQNTFFYRPGDIIGIGQNQDTEGDDTDETLLRFEGAHLIRVVENGIVCRWGKEEVTVTVAMNDDPKGLTAKGNGVNIGSLKGGGRGPAGPPIDGTKLATVDARGSMVRITEEGLRALEGGGGDALADISFEKAITPKNPKALKIKKLPAALKDYGFEDGDIIVRIDGRAVTSKESIANHVKRSYKTKKFYNLEIMRNGATRNVRVNVPTTNKGRSDAMKRMSGNRSGRSIRPGGRRGGRR